MVTYIPPAGSCQRQAPCPSPMGQQPTDPKPLQQPPHPLAARALLQQGWAMAVPTTTATLPNPAQAEPWSHHTNVLDLAGLSRPLGGSARGRESQTSPGQLDTQTPRIKRTVLWMGREVPGATSD